MNYRWKIFFRLHKIQLAKCDIDVDKSLDECYVSSI
jgi:hypothetical protein